MEQPERHTKAEVVHIIPAIFENKISIVLKLQIVYLVKSKHYYFYAFVLKSCL